MNGNINNRQRVLDTKTFLWGAGICEHNQNNVLYAKTFGDLAEVNTIIDNVLYAKHCGGLANGIWDLM